MSAELVEAPPPADADERLMDLALEAAASADFWTSPNPMVGAVLSHDGEVVGTGSHRRAGGEHAEVAALAAAGERARGAQLHVTLEPCSRHGRTPPCVEALVAAGIGRCVVAMQDPNPGVDGAGIAALRAAGITVVVGVREHRARRLNDFYCKHISTRMPFVTAKFAMSLDGKIATHSGETRWITSERSRELVHRMRHAHDVIMVGANTVIRDDPQLTTRRPAAEGPGRSPLRVVVDSRLRISPEARIFSEPAGSVLVATTDRARGERVREFEARGHPLEIFASREGRVGLDQLLRRLGELEHVSVLVEGGSSIHGSAFEQRLVDRVVAIIAPRVIGGVEAPGAVGGHGVDRLAEALLLDEVRVSGAGPDLVVSGYCAGAPRA